MTQPLEVYCAVCCKHVAAGHRCPPKCPKCGDTLIISSDGVSPVGCRNPRCVSWAYKDSSGEGRSHSDVNPSQLTSPAGMRRRLKVHWKQRAESSERRVAILEPIVKGLAKFFTDNHANPGVELYGMVSYMGTRTETESAKELNKLVRRAAEATKEEHGKQD